MPQDGFYRYVSSNRELQQLREKRLIRTANPHGGGRTYFTNERIDDPAFAQMLLALPKTPLYRVGPIPADEMPVFDVLNAQRVQPGYAQPGGGLEYCTTEPLFVFGWYDYENMTWEQF
jgi:hypothetical protein